MPPLPVISGREAAKAFQKIGFLFHHQTGSHMIYYRSDGRHLSIPVINSSIEEPCEASSKARASRSNNSSTCCRLSPAASIAPHIHPSPSAGCLAGLVVR